MSEQFQLASDMVAFCSGNQASLPLYNLVPTQRISSLEPLLLVCLWFRDSSCSRSTFHSIEEVITGRDAATSRVLRYYEEAVKEVQAEGHDTVLSTTEQGKNIVQALHGLKADANTLKVDDPVIQFAINLYQFPGAIYSPVTRYTALDGDMENNILVMVRIREYSYYPDMAEEEYKTSQHSPSRLVRLMYESRVAGLKSLAEKAANKLLSMYEYSDAILMVAGLLTCNSNNAWERSAAAKMFKEYLQANPTWKNSAEIGLQLSTSGISFQQAPSMLGRRRLPTRLTALPALPWNAKVAETLQ